MSMQHDDRRTERAIADRRKAPRRESERKLHYAREHLLALALELAEDPMLEPTEGGMVVRLIAAAADFRAAEASVMEDVDAERAMQDVGPDYRYRQ
jgi:hypothetical protein